MTAEPKAPSIESRFASLDAVRDLLARQEDLPQGAIQAIQSLSGELRRATEELSDADTRYRAVVEQIPAIVYTDVVDDTMSTTYVSPQIEDLLGISPEEYIADPDLWAKQLHPDDKEQALQSYLQGRKSGEPFSFEYRLLGKDGRVVWFRDSAVVVNDRSGAPAFVHGVMFDITDRKNAEERVAFLAYHDNLTGLPNRTMFEELLELGMARARRHDLSVAVLCIDVDDFKLVNESLGYEAGDALLRAVAERLREATRETDLVARQGGDEFLLLLADIEGSSAPGFEGTDGALLSLGWVTLRQGDVQRRRHRAVRLGEHRHQHVPPRRRRRHGAPEERRRCHVPEQEVGSRELPPPLEAERGGPGQALPHNTPPKGRGEPELAAPLPAGRGAGGGEDGRRRGPDPVGRPQRRPGPSR